MNPFFQAYLFYDTWNNCLKFAQQFHDGRTQKKGREDNETLLKWDRDKATQSSGDTCEALHLPSSVIPFSPLVIGRVCGCEYELVK